MTEEDDSISLERQQQLYKATKAFARGMSAQEIALVVRQLVGSLKPTWPNLEAAERAVSVALGLHEKKRTNPRLMALWYIEVMLPHWRAVPAVTEERGYWVDEGRGIRSCLTRVEPEFGNLNEYSVATRLCDLGRIDGQAERLLADLASMVSLEGWSLSAIRKAEQR